ncbi:MAG TPA: hypothetical protein VGJ44_04310, partial [Kribbellaceae bacterium]
MHTPVTNAPVRVEVCSKTSYAARREAGVMTNMNTGKVNPVPDGYHALTPYLADWVHSSVVHYCADVDATHARALEHGARQVEPVATFVTGTG